jgi:hypothetical protein
MESWFKYNLLIFVKTKKIFEMKSIINYLIYASILISLISCKEFLDINKDPNSPTDINNLDLLLTDMTSTTAYNLVGGGNFNRIGSQWVQHIADNSEPPNDDSYRIFTADFNNEWQYISYAGVLINAKYVIDKGTELERWNHVAVAKILMAHNYAILTDWWGDIPFSEALKRTEVPQPKYDTQEQVYVGIQALLDEAIVDIDKNSATKVGTGDFFFKGNMTKWKKVAYLLKARYHLRLTNAPGKDAVTQANLALDALENGLESAADNAAFTYPGGAGAEAPWNQWISKFATTIQMSKFFVDMLSDLGDPRLPILADTNKNGAYVGYVNGSGDNTPLAEISNIGAKFRNDKESVFITSYVEQKFLEAEALFLTGDVDGAEEAYKLAIAEHMKLITSSNTTKTISDTDRDTYIGTDPFDGLSSDEIYEKIMTQKYIGSFVYASHEAFNDYRRTGFPATLQPALNGFVNQIPTRLPYPDTEIGSNLINVPPDVKLTSKVWWDGD